MKKFRKAKVTRIYRAKTVGLKEELKISRGVDSLDPLTKYCSAPHERNLNMRPGKEISQTISETHSNSSSNQPKWTEPIIDRYV